MHIETDTGTFISSMASTTGYFISDFSPIIYLALGIVLFAGFVTFIFSFFGKNVDENYDKYYDEDY
jgi:hypothetical protein